MEPRFTSQYGGYEERHWWFRARRAVLRRLLADLPWREGLRVLEIGVGSGTNLYGAYPPGGRLVGVEPDPGNAKTAAARGPVPVHIGRAEALPPELGPERFDVVTMFDVLEHTEHDVEVLRGLRDRVADGGWIVLTVPAYRWLWGVQDRVSHHYRRYGRKELARKLREAGYEPERLTYFNTVLFPAIALLRWFRERVRGGRAMRRSDFEYTLGPLDGLLCRLFAAEACLLRFVNLPFGVSLYAAGRKRVSS